MAIKDTIKNVIKHSIPEKVKGWIINDHMSFANLTYSQEGEDRLLERLLNRKAKGVYIDVGAHHPLFISNTYLFYKRGWRGINIDATPGTMKLFDRYRPEDVNIEVPISNISENLDFFIFSSPELNTFSEKNAEEFLKWPGVKLLRKVKLQTRTLAEVLDSYLRSDHIDFLSVDVEGFDLNVLKSNNWEKYRPDFILVEELRSNITENANGEIAKFLNEKDYSLISKTYNTVFYKNNAVTLNM